MDFGRCQLPCSHLIVSEGQHGKRIRCVGLAHAQDDIFAISNCMYCENFTLKTLRASLAFFYRESAVLTCRVAPEASVLREAEAWSSEAQHKFSGPVFLHPTRKHETTFPSGWRIFYIPQPPTLRTSGNTELVEVLPLHPPPYTVWGARSRSASRQRPVREWI